MTMNITLFLSLILLLLVLTDPVYGFSMMIAPSQYSTSSLRTTDSSSPYEQSCKRSSSLSFLPKSNHHFMVTTNRNWNLDKSALCMSSISNNNDSSSSPLKIIISGAPASGKGTQCENIINNYGVIHLSTGDILRKAVSDQTDIGLLAKQHMDQGQLVPDHVIISIVQERLMENDCITCGWLLDGFPRTKEQAIALENVGIQPDVFLFLNVPDEMLIERVIGRRLDPMTNKIYHLTFSPPPSDEEILSRLIHRSDDTAEKVVVRLQQFHSHVNAIKDSYEHISTTIDGNQSPTTVSKQIAEAIENIIKIKKQMKQLSS